jgi:ribosomal protein S14
MHLEYRLGMEASREEVRGAAEAGDAPGVRRGIRAARRRMTLARSPEARSLDRRAAACVRRIGRDAGLLGEAFGAAAAARVLREAADGLLSGRHPKKV